MCKYPSASMQTIKYSGHHAKCYASKLMRRKIVGLACFCEGRCGNIADDGHQFHRLIINFIGHLLLLTFINASSTLPTDLCIYGLRDDGGVADSRWKNSDQFRLPKNCLAMTNMKRISALIDCQAPTKAN